MNEIRRPASPVKDSCALDEAREAMYRALEAYVRVARNAGYSDGFEDGKQTGFRDSLAYKGDDAEDAS